MGNAYAHTENQLGDTTPFSMRGRSPQRAITQGRAYLRARNTPYAELSWNAHGWDWKIVLDGGQTWTFVELTSTKELFEEGQYHRHCVGEYGPRCASGHSAIVSMRYNNFPQITIEVAPLTMRIVQARGRQNRSAQPHEATLIQQWFYTISATQS